MPVSPDTTIVIIGGDQRELYLADYLLSSGYSVRLCGFEKQSKLPAPNYLDPHEAARGVQVVIIPLSGLKETMQPNCKFSEAAPVLDEDFFMGLPAQTPVFIGWARPALRDLARTAGVRLIEIGEDDELAILNSIPTAEGMIYLAMEKTSITIHGSNCLVIGFGRCGFSLARMLKGMGANVMVAARKAPDLARAYEMGFETCLISELDEAVKDKEFIFNTATAMVLTKYVLQNATRCQIILDMASGKGGTDFEAAEALCMQAILVPGLPGIIAPVSAGKILARVYPRLLKENGINGGKGR